MIEKKELLGSSAKDKTKTGTENKGSTTKEISCGFNAESRINKGKISEN